VTTSPRARIRPVSEHIEIRYLTQAEAAALLGVSTRTLRRWSEAGDGPPVTWVRGPAGDGLIRRWRSDRVIAWAEAEHARVASDGRGGPA